MHCYGQMDIIKSSYSRHPKQKFKFMGKDINAILGALDLCQNLLRAAFVIDALTLCRQMDYSIKLDES